MLEEVGRTMILAEALHWPCDIKSDGISILHGSSIARDSKTSQSKYQMYKVRARLAECRKLFKNLFLIFFKSKIFLS